MGKQREHANERKEQAAEERIAKEKGEPKGPVMALLYLLFETPILVFYFLPNAFCGIGNRKTPLLAQVIVYGGWTIALCNFG